MEAMLAILLLWPVGEAGAFGDQQGHEQRLFKHIMSGYSVLSRPIRNASQPVRLKFGATLNQILDLDGKHQILSTYIWIHERWRDENLCWNPRDYNWLESIVFPATNVWLPDIYVFNVAGRDLNGLINISGSNIVVSHDGNIQWTIPIQIKTACPVDATYFPYDKQTCQIQFVSWIHDISQLEFELNPTHLELTHYVLNSEFDLLDSSMEILTMDGSCCPGSGDRQMIRIWLKIRRKTLYYDYIVIAPTIDLCVLTLATFLLPCECGWKIAIGLTVFLTLYVLQLLIAENVPDTNSTPLIGVFLLLVMSLNCISLITATMVLNIKRRAQHDPIPAVSPWLLYVCEKYLSKITCTTMSDWKRMTEAPDESAVAAGIEDHHMNEDEHENEQYTEITPTDTRRYSGARSHFSRTKTAESAFSSNSGTDDTAKLLQKRPRVSIGPTSTIPTINLSYSPDDETPTYVFNIEEDPAMKGDNHNLDILQTDNSPQLVRKRPSYRKAIHGGLEEPSENRVNLNTPRHKSSVKRKSIFSGKNAKYQWYFVADVIDTMTFIVYVIVMFFGILAVLVIVPLFA